MRVQVAAVPSGQDLPFKTHVIDMVPSRPANTGIHDTSDVLKMTCGVIELFNGDVQPLKISQWPEAMQALCDPHSDKVRALVNLSSSALDMAPPTPGVQSLSILVGSAKLLHGTLSHALSPREVALEGGELAAQTLSVVSEHFGWSIMANVGHTVAILLGMADASTRLILASPVPAQSWMER